MTISPIDFNVFILISELWAIINAPGGTMKRFLLMIGFVSMLYAQPQNGTRPTIATEADFRRAMKELSNWGRWGDKDELGAANLITPAKRKQALALAKEGITVSLAHDVAQEKALDATTILERQVVTVSPTVAMDSYQSTGTYHGVI